MNENDSMQMPPVFQGTGEASVSPQASPPTMYASQSLLTGTLAEILLTLGQTRVVANSGTAPFIAIEWLATVAMSPVVAKQIGSGLIALVDAWEKQHNTKLPNSIANVEPSK